MSESAQQETLLDAIAAADAAAARERPNWLPDQREREKIRQRDKARLLPVLQTLHARHGGEGFTAADVIAEAILANVFTGEEWRHAQRAYSWIGPWLRALAGRGFLAPFMVGAFHARRLSTRDRSHGNSQLVWLAGPKWAELSADTVGEIRGRHG